MTMPNQINIQTLLKEKLVWIKVPNQPKWRGEFQGNVCELMLGDFPDEPLYTLVALGQSLEFDDTPSGWVIP